MDECISFDDCSFVYVCIISIHYLIKKKLLANISRPILLEKTYTSGYVLSSDRLPLFCDMKKTNHHKTTNLICMPKRKKT